MRDAAVIVLVVVALTAGLHLATSGKECHVNVHLSKRLYCTERTSQPTDTNASRSEQLP